MTPVRVLTVVGTRPEAIKMAPVVRELRSRGRAVRVTICSTGQHREMLAQAFDLFGLQPDTDLAVMEPDQTLSGLTARLLVELDRTIGELRPDWLLAQGDTTTVMAASLAAFYRGVRFGHVEAGLRTGDLGSPFPEEMNRRVADLLAHLYFAPTARARDALLAEGVPAERVLLTGNTVVDALLDVSGRPFDWSGSPLAAIPEDAPMVLVTAHRRESFGQPFANLCRALRDLAIGFAARGVHFVYPVHLNPNVQAPARAILGGLDNLHLLPPLDYLSLVNVMKRSLLILTDSGGIQEEAPGLRVPVLVMRETTERPEGVEAGVVRLVGTDRETIVREASRLLADESARAAMRTEENPYGDGRAAKRIVDALLEHTR